MRRVEVVPDQLECDGCIAGAAIFRTWRWGLVHDEYGHSKGIRVNPVDLLTAIVAPFASDQDEGDDPQVVERETGR